MIPPYPPQWAPGAAHVHRQCVPWSPGPSIFRSFFRFDFGLDFGLVLDPFWARLGLLLAPFWEPKSGQVGPKMRLEAIFFRKRRFSRGTTFSNEKSSKSTPRRAQDRLKTDPRRVQERQKSDAFFVFIFDSFFYRFGVVLGAVLGAKIDPKSQGRLAKVHVVFDLVG